MRKSSETFIGSIIKELLSDEGVDYSRTYIILPTRRSVRFAKEYLAIKSARSVIIPKILSFESFVNSCTGLEIIGKEESLKLIHTVFTDISQKYNFPFSDFLDYAFLLLKDFDQIDQNLVDVKSIFANLSAKESLDRWASELEAVENISFDQSGIMSDYFTFWEICSDVYFGLQGLLQTENKAYQGMSYRIFLEQFDTIKDKIDCEHVIFAGFNYLTASQKSILLCLQKEFPTRYIWDIDAYFLERKYHEAGKYLRTYTSFNGGVNARKILDENNFPELNIQSCPNKNSQVKKVVDDVIDILEKLDFESEIKPVKDLIAIIPADESLLKILLESFPEKIIDKNSNEVEIAPLLNISMGRSVLESQFASLLQLLFSIKESLSNNPQRIHYKLVRSVLVHPLIKNALMDAEEMDAYDARVRLDNRLFLKMNDDLFSGKDAEIFQLILKSPDLKSGDFTGYVLNVLNHILDHSANLGEDEKIILSFLKSVFNELRELLEHISKDLDANGFKSLVFELLRQYKVPFAGEPVSPIQIIGLLETRAIDFEHVFILSCNEGELPTNRSIDSLIPFEIKKAFNLPTFLDKDASLSYTFYRLFYRSRSINLYYHNSNDSLSGKASPSRFLMQLEYELLPDFNLANEVKPVSHPFAEVDSDRLSIEKTEGIIKAIEVYLSGRNDKGEIRYGLSPSMLNTYLRSPVEFFKRAVLKIKEADILEEGFRASTFGTIIHEVLEDLFTPYLGQEINEELINSILKKTRLSHELENKAKALAGDIILDEGINKLYLRSAELLIEKYLQLLKKDNFLLLRLETPMKHSFEITVENSRRVLVTITGKADRIDFSNNAIRIVDYKTGSMEDDYISLASRELLWDSKHRDKILQLMIYKYLLIKNRAQLFPEYENADVEPGFYFFRKGNKVFMKLSMYETENEDAFCQEVEYILQQIIGHMLDSSIPFKSEIESDITL